MEYLIVVPVEFYPLDQENVACESAFAEHLKLLLKYVSHFASTIHVVAPAMSEQDYSNRKTYLTNLNLHADKIKVSCVFEGNIGRLKYTFGKIIGVYKAIKQLSTNASVIHSGPSSNLFRIFEIFSIYIAVRNKIPSVFVVDIDQRESANMDYHSGNLSTKSYLLRKYIYDPFVDYQIRFAVKHCTLVLLKGESLTRDFGKGASNVKNFLDSAHDATAIIPQSLINKKSAVLSGRPFRLVYFGRLTSYKGILDMIKVTEISNENSDLDVTLTIIGEGEQKEELLHAARSIKNSDIIKFKQAIPYGKNLFNEIQQYDVLLAAPQRQDTPRNVFDAMSNGLPIVAYDTYYYRNLQSSGAIITTPWKNVTSMSQAVVSLTKDDQRRKEMIRAAVTFAQKNTQEYWLEQRKQWLDEAILDEH